MVMKELKAEMVRRGFSVKDLAEACGVSLNAFYKRLEGRIEFKQREIQCICNVMNLGHDDIMQIFFAKEVS